MKDIIEIFKVKNSKLLIPLLLVSTAWTIYIKIDVKKFEELWNLFKERSIIILITLLVITVIQKVLRYSHDKSQEVIDEYLSRQGEPLTIDRPELTFEVLDSRNLLNIRVIANEDIHFAEGYFYLLIKKERIRKIHFKLHELKVGVSERLYNINFNSSVIEEFNFDQFEFFIENIVTSKGTRSAIIQTSNRIVRTHFLALNIEQFYDTKILGLKTKFNVIWLKKIIRENIFYRILYVCRKKVYKRNETFLEKYSDLLFRILIGIGFFMLALVLLSLFAMYLFNLSILLFELIDWLFSTLSDFKK